MTPRRPKSLKWIGERYPDGRPARFLAFVPDRDLTEAETDALDQDQLAAIRASGLYREVHPSERKAAKRAPEASERTEAADTADDAEPAAEPATEGEDS